MATLLFAQQKWCGNNNYKLHVKMTTDNIIDLLIIACGGLLVWSIAATLMFFSERNELKKLHQLRKEQQKQDN